MANIKVKIRILGFVLMSNMRNAAQLGERFVTRRAHGRTKGSRWREPLSEGVADGPDVQVIHGTCN